MREILSLEVPVANSAFPAIQCDVRFMLRSDLRLSNKSGNGANSKTRDIGCGKYTSQYKGVYRASHAKSNPWRAGIVGKYIGSFANEGQAARAYDAAARLRFGEFARTNFP